MTEKPPVTDPIVQPLLQKAERSLKAAQDSFNDGNFEFVASRAYYSMFYLAEALLLLKDLSFSKHSGVVSAFAVHYTKPGIIPQQYHRALMDAFEDRQIADYESIPIFGRTEAEHQLQRAYEFMSHVRQWLENRGLKP
jgi:uncharacterized protein (UPF0332 family)